MPAIAIDTQTSGDNTLIAAPGIGKFIRVLGYVLVGGGAVLARWKDSIPTNLSGAMSLTNGGGVSAAPSELGHLECSPNAALVLNLSAAVQVSGHLLYRICG